MSARADKGEPSYIDKIDAGKAGVKPRFTAWTPTQTFTPARAYERIQCHSALASGFAGIMSPSCIFYGAPTIPLPPNIDFVLLFCLIRLTKEEAFESMPEHLRRSLPTGLVEAIKELSFSTPQSW